MVGLATEVLGALAEAHELGLVHRDLKPGNLMLARDPEGAEHAKVLDFGMAKVLEGDAVDNDVTRSGVVLGTPKYLSPEQARGRDVGPAADVYGLGVTLWEMLAGRPPYAAPSTFELLMMHSQADIPPLPAELEVPAALEAIVRRAMAKSVDDRYPDAGTMLADLRDYAGQDVSVELPRPVRADSGDRSGGLDDTVTMGTDQLLQVGETSASQSAVAGETIAEPMPPPERRTPWLAVGGGVAALGFVVWLLMPGAPPPPEPAAAAPVVIVEHDRDAMLPDDVGVPEDAATVPTTERAEMFLKLAEIAKGTPEEGKLLGQAEDETTGALAIAENDDERAQLLAHRAVVRQRRAHGLEGDDTRLYLQGALADLTIALRHDTGGKTSFRRYRDAGKVAFALHGAHTDAALDFVCDPANLADRKHRMNHCATLLLRAGDAIEKDEPVRAAKLTCRGYEAFETELKGQSEALAQKRQAQKTHYAARCRKLSRALPDAGAPPAP